MRDLLVQLGVSQVDVILESRATTTYENATDTRGREHRQVVVVTKAIHLPRAMNCFCAVGIHAVAAPCRLRASELKPELATCVPSPSARGALTAVLHEWLGLTWYRLRGRI